MIFRETLLKKTGAKLFEYISDSKEIKPAMLVIPGGGYSVVCTEREGEPIALAYLALGYNSFVLHYSVGKDARDGKPLAQASEAVAYIRKNSGSIAIDPAMVFAVGFSAGGHLCGSLATMWHSENCIKAAGINAGENRPDGKRTAPSALNTQVITIYVALQDGIYKYNPQMHTLEAFSKEDIRPIIGSKAPVILLYVANLARQSKYLAAVDCGFIGQNVYLYSAANNLNTVFLYGVNSSALNYKLGLKLGEEVLFAQLVSNAPSK